MGMWLPNPREIQFFNDHFPEVREALSNALSHPNDSIRMRAAYVIREMGVTAQPLGDSLLERLQVEPDRLVRIYLVDALSAIQHATDESVAVLTERFDALDSENVPPNPDYLYAEVDEKVVVAAALFSLGGEETKPAYLQFVTQWLNPPPSDLEPTLLGGYWERRWIAVNSLESMPGAVAAIPQLEALRQEEGAQNWVEFHIPRVLRVLRESKEQSSHQE